MRIAENQKPPPGELCLDHVAHFVPDLDAAARLLERLGFAATPVSHHKVAGEPVGTANRCIMLEEGYIEILAPTLDTPNARRVRERMARYQGVHLACFGTPDAEGEQRRLAAHGFDPEPLVSLERTLEDGDTVRFRVVYVPPAKMPEGRVQYVEHLTPEAIWDEASLAHDNGVTGLQAIYVVAEQPAEVAARWARFSGLLPLKEGKLVRLDCARGMVFFGTQADLGELLGACPPAPGLAGYALAFRHPDEFAARCRKNGIKVRKTPGGFAASLPSALGGVWLF